MPKALKIRRLHIFAMSPEKMRGEVNFLPANNQESFLQVYSITLCLSAKPGMPKGPKTTLRYLCNISMKT